MTISTVTGFSIGPPGFVKQWNSRIAVALNFGATLAMNNERKNVFGLPSPCFGNASVRVYEFNPKELRLQHSRTISAFKASSLSVADGTLYIGGEALDDCSLRGRAAIYSLQVNGDASPFWSEDTPFSSNVVSMNVLDGRLLAAIRYEYTLGLDAQPTSLEEVIKRSGDYTKRWGDKDFALQEASLLSIDRAGRIAERKNFSAGLSVFVQGLDVIGTRPILYGAVGGIPTVTLQ